ncbi:MAG: arylsulfatase [Myxococcota bacterium]|jgi:arylsulfatase
MLLLLTIACRSTIPDPTAAARPLTLSGGGAAVDRLLDCLATVTLPQVDPVPLTSGERPVPGPWEAASRGAWRTPSPIRLPDRPYREAPSGMTLLRSGSELPWASARSAGWRIQGQDILIHSKTSPEDIVLIDTTSAAAATRLSPMRSGLSPEAYIRTTVEISGLSLSSFLLPAPTRITCPVSIATGSRLRFSVAMARPVDHGVTGEARLTVSRGEETLWTGMVRHGEDWRSVSVTVPPGAGEITFHSDPVGASVWDSVAVGNPEIIGPASPDGPRRILLIGLDTLRPDHLGVMGYPRPTSENLDALAAQSILLTGAVAPAPRTRPSFRTATTGRWPLAAITAPTLGATLSQAGFSTAGIVANVHLSPLLGMSEGYDHWDYHDGDIAEEQVDRALSWLSDHRDEDSFLFVHFMDPHVFYLAPGKHLDRFTDGLIPEGIGDRFNRWSIDNRADVAPLTVEERAFIIGRYDGELSYLDEQLGRLIAEALALPGETLLILHSDHGEEFWEHGSYEHNHSLYQEVIGAMLWIRPPGGWSDGPHRIEATTSLADIAPTLYDLLDLTQPPPSDGTSLLPLLAPQPDPALLSALESRSLPLGHMMFDTERWGVIRGDGKYILHTDSGQEELYDLATDPGEQDDLAADRDLTPWRAALAEATGWPVETGWRVRLSGRTEPLVLTFPAPVRAVGVIDPEAARPRRANLEWGEVPPVRPGDVAAVVLSADATAVTITPGPSPVGTLYLIGPDATTPARTGAGGTIGHGYADRTLRIEAGAIIVPQDSEAARLTALADPESWDALKAMGYVE